MIVAGQLLNETDDPAQSCSLTPGYLRIAEGRIVEVVRLGVEETFPSGCDFGGPNFLITPGLVDTHLHLPQFNQIGAHGLPLLEWLDVHTFPQEALWEDSDYAAEMTRRVARQLHAHGTTAICAYSSVHYEATRAAIDTLAEASMRGWVGLSLADRYAPERVRRGAEELIEQTAELIENYPPGSQIAAAITPRFAASCTEGLLTAAGRLAAENRGVLIQSHLSETQAERELIAKLFPGRSYVQAYGDYGLLTERTLLGHGIWLSSDERRDLCDSQTVIAHCPTANTFLRSGAMHRAELLRSGVRVSLGSDIGAGYERSMVRVARAMVETAAAVGAEIPTAGEAWWTITAGNADAARLDAGRLLPGAVADLLVIEPDMPWQDTGVDPLSMLLFAWDDRWLRQTIVAGQVVYESS